MEEQTTTKLNKFSLPELKNSSDDELAIYLRERGYQRRFTLIDIRLTLGYLAVLASIVASSAGYFLSFNDSKIYVIPGVCLYFIFNGLYNGWMWFVCHVTCHIDFLNNNSSRRGLFTKEREIRHR